MVCVTADKLKFCYNTENYGPCLPVGENILRNVKCPQNKNIEFETSNAKKHWGLKQCNLSNYSESTSSNVS